MSKEPKEDLVKEATAMVMRLGRERASAFCKAVTHRVDFFDAQQLIKRLGNEVERLNSLNSTQQESIREFQREHTELQAKIDKFINSDFVCSRCGSPKK